MVVSQLGFLGFPDLSDSWTRIEPVVAPADRAELISGHLDQCGASICNITKTLAMFVAEDATLQSDQAGRTP